MATGAQSQNHLAHVQTGTLSSRSSKFSVRSLERGLLKLFPAQDAEVWDRTGLLVGDPMTEVTGVAVALDPSLAAISAARKAGANVLLTHHPAFLEAPELFVPALPEQLNSGSTVWVAIQNQVALMSFHTCLDVSYEAAHVLPNLLSLTFKRVLDPINEDGSKGYGQICELTETEDELSLGHLAARCTSVFGRHPRVWGDFSTKVTRIVTCTGSAGDLPAKALEAHADVLICGEIRYHDALEACEAGLNIIDIGHDTSELPLVGVLVTALEKIDFAQDAITVIDQGSHWDSPETTRL
ncbi:MAG: Nif3-like dinuclear metal center hexameric protein [Raoultibacter sp.]|jgi:dinuclear metal center YbgI/SA1388 family protein